MDSDDICSRKNRIESQYEFLKNNQDIDVVGSEIIEFYDDGKERYSIHMTTIRLRKNFRLRTAIPHVSAFFRSSFFIKAGKYNTTQPK